MMIHGDFNLRFPSGLCLTSAKQSKARHRWKIVKNIVTKIKVLLRLGAKCSFKVEIAQPEPHEHSRIRPFHEHSSANSFLMNTLKFIEVLIGDFLKVKGDILPMNDNWTCSRDQCDTAFGERAGIISDIEVGLKCKETIMGVGVPKRTRVNPGISSSGFSLSGISLSSAGGIRHHKLMSGEYPNSEPGTQCEDEECSGDSTEATDSQSEVTSHVPRITQPARNEFANSGPGCRKRSTATEMKDDMPKSMMGTAFSDRWIEAAIEAGARCEFEHSGSARRKRSTVMKDDLISMIGPLLNQRIEAVIEARLSELRSKGEEEQMYQDKLLAMEERKLALKRQKILFTQRVLASAKLKYRPSRPQVHQEPNKGLSESCPDRESLLD